MIVALYSLKLLNRDSYERLVSRNDLSLDKIESRVKAKNELKKSTYFDHLVINDSLDETIGEVKDISISMIRFDDIVEKLNPYLKSSDIDEKKKTCLFCKSSCWTEKIR